MSLQTIHLTQGDHNAALVACQHPAATEDDKAFLGYVASLYVICERISRDDYHRLQAILRRLDGAQADAPQPTTTPAPVEAGATPTAILAEIRAYASSLEVFAWAATENMLPSDAEQHGVMLENTLLVLARLEKLHAELKQAIAGEDRT